MKTPFSSFKRENDRIEGYAREYAQKFPQWPPEPSKLYGAHDQLSEHLRSLACMAFDNGVTPEDKEKFKLKLESHGLSRESKVFTYFYYNIITPPIYKDICDATFNDIVLPNAYDHYKSVANNFFDVVEQKDIVTELLALDLGPVDSAS